MPPQYGSPRFVCTACGNETDHPDRVKPGSGWVTATLLGCMVVPGIVYWVWRHSMKEDRCPLCHRQTLIPSASPVGRSILASPYRLADPAITPQPQDVRLERIEQAIDAIAIEVERVAESQRYAARQLER